MAKITPRPTKSSRKSGNAFHGLTFQDMILRLSAFWARQGCVLALPYDLEVGAGTMCPETFFRVLGPDPWRVAYVQPSRRPADGRYGENPNRLLKHTQMQVILKPPPSDVQDVYLRSLRELGIDLRHHDIRFEEDNWEAPTLGAWGIGWQVMLDGLEITQFTYFQQSGGFDLEPISCELTYGLERIAAFLQEKESVYDVVWVRAPEAGKVATYGDVRLTEERQFSVYNFEIASAEFARRHIELYELECQRLIEGFEMARGGATDEMVRTGLKGLVDDSGKPVPLVRYPVLAAFDLCLKCSHLFNILDARGSISVTERVALITRVRDLACGVAKIYLEQQGIAQPAAEERPA